MKYHWRYCSAQWYRRYGKVSIIVSLCLSLNFIGHMLVCLPVNPDLHAMTIDKHSRYPDHRESQLNVEQQLSPKSQKAFLVIAILSGPYNSERRKAIRETWLSNLPNDVLRFFVLGTKSLSNEDRAALEYEQQENKDLILLTDFEDAYSALTSKVIRTFQWLNDNVDFSYILKVDDDTFARVDVIKSELKERGQAEHFYWGFFDGRARVKKSGQWAEHDWILCDTYLPHARGGGYVLSADLVEYIANNANRLKKFKSEDISVGAWLGPLDIERLHDPRFDTEYRSRGCSNTYIVTHKQEPRDMKEKDIMIRTSGKLCKNEVKLRNSYKYNWAVPPSGCCARDDPSIP